MLTKERFSWNWLATGWLDGHFQPFQCHFKPTWGAVIEFAFFLCYFAPEIKNQTDMEIVIIEKKAFEDFIQTVEYFISRIASMDARKEDKQPEQWLDTADMCAGLQLDRRTVYSLREQGKLPFSQFQHRVYYKAKDVKALADGITAKSPKSEETEIVNPSK